MKMPVRENSKTGRQKLEIDPVSGSKWYAKSPRIAGISAHFTSKFKRDGTGWLCTQSAANPSLKAIP